MEGEMEGEVEGEGEVGSGRRDESEVGEIWSESEKEGRDTRDDDGEERERDRER